MIIPQFTAPSYGNRSINSLQSCINLFPEKVGDGFQLVGTSGLKLLATTANNQPCRGAIYVIYDGIGKIYSLHSSTLYRIDFDGTRAVISTGVMLGSDRVSMAYNGTQLIIVDGFGGHIVTVSSEAFATITDANFPSHPRTVTYQDGYFIVSDQFTNNFYLSAVDDGLDWTPLTRDGAVGHPDDLTCVISNGSNLYLIGSRVSEVWYNTGNSTFPFERISGALLEAGSTSYTTIDSYGGTIFFVGSGKVSQGSVWMIAGTVLTKISTPAIEEFVFDWPLFTDNIFGFCYEERGHAFYQITLRGSKTFVYDIGMGVWHQKTSSALGHHRAAIILNAFELPASFLFFGPYAFDTENGRIYNLYPKYNQENGEDIVRTRDFGPIGGGNQLIHSRMRIDLEAKHDSSASYTLSATLQKTDDAGLTFSTAQTLSKTITSGTTGQSVRFSVNRLGSAAERWYRLIFTGPAIKLILKSCDLELSEGRN